MSNRFVNPYNFIHFPKAKAKKYSDTDKHTGVIEYTLTTKSPLFIPNSSNDNAFDSPVEGHKTYDFYSYTDLSNRTLEDNEYNKPVIPGSEMRGLIRSTYETLTDSCMGLLNDVHPVKRVGARFKPGLLTFNNNKLGLIRAKSLRIHKSDCKGRCDGDPISFNMPLEKHNERFRYYDKITDFSFDEDVCDYVGYLIKWGFGVKKRNNYHVFYYENDYDYEIRDLDPSEIKRMVKDVIESYKEQSTVEDANLSAYEAYQSAFKNFMQNNGDFFPINYAIVEGNLYLSPATFSKEVFKNSVGDLTIFKPCVKDCCPACDLFGRVGDNAKGSLIRFSDLSVENRADNKDYYYCDSITLSNLNSPKLANVDFYLEKPEGARYWSYDYLVRYKKELSDDKLKIELSDGKLKGRKYYWHFPNDVTLKRGVEPKKLNKSVRPLKKNVSFKGKLYFDGISQRQLKQLIYILNTSSENLGLKLGMGKPLGMGSVALKVEKVKLREISLDEDNNLSYVENDFDFSNIDYDSAGLSKSVKAEFKKIAYFNAVPSDVPVCYPITSSNDDNGFEWFLANHSKNGFTSMPKERKNMHIRYALPNILDKDVALPRLDRATANSNNNNRNKNNSNNKNCGKRTWR